MELLDVLDEKGNKIGEKERSEILKCGDRHRTVHIWILNSKNEILMQKRNPKKDTYPNLWAMSCAGHVMAGETNIEAAKRELKEELNLTVIDEELEYLFTITRHEELKDAIINSFDDVYLLRREVDIEHTKLQKSELTDINFFEYNVLKEKLDNKDETFVPKSHEHTKLFDFLETKLNNEELESRLYKIDTKVTIKSYYRYLVFNYYHMNSIKILNILIYLFIFGFSSLMIFDNKVLLSIPAILIGIIYPLITLFCFKAYANKSNIINNSLHYDFYEDFFKVIDKEELKYYYYEIKNIFSVNKYIYIILETNKYFIINKEDCNDDLIKFLIEKIKKYNI